MSNSNSDYSINEDGMVINNLEDAIQEFIDYPSDVCEIILSVTKKHSSGFDDAHCSLQRSVIEHVIESLCYLIDYLFDIGNFPGLKLISYQIIEE